MSKEAEISLLRKIIEDVCKNVEQACFLHEGERNLQKNTFREKWDRQLSLTFSFIGYAHLS